MLYQVEALEVRNTNCIHGDTSVLCIIRCLDSFEVKPGVLSIR